MYASFFSLASNIDTQEEFKGFFQAYHKHLQDKFGFPPLKVSKALHAASEVMGHESWHHISAKSKNLDTESGNIKNEPSRVNDKQEAFKEIWVARCIEDTGDMYDPEIGDRGHFSSKQKAVDCLWRFVKRRMSKRGAWLDMFRDVVIDDWYECKTFDKDVINEFVDLCETGLSLKSVSLTEDGNVKVGNREVVSDDIKIEIIDYYFNQCRDVTGDYSLYPTSIK